jgi:NAD(P)-dependent dehydrogenase (short-subunit alcohol dehydrogenase family)
VSGASELGSGPRRFEHRAALVTGGSSGIGLATAKRLAAEGASLCIVAAPQDEGLLQNALAVFEQAGTKAVGLARDIGETGTADEAVQLTLRTFGRLDYLVNNAGIGPKSEVFDNTTELYDEVMRVNVRGMFLAAMAAARAMAASDDEGHAIVCTASTASFMGEERQVVYNISKAAIIGLVRSLGVALAPYGIRVNAVAPGYVRHERSSGYSDPAHWSRARSRIPADRPASAEEIAAAIAFLVSHDATYVSGSTLVVDGAHTAGWRNTGWDAVTVDETGPRGRLRLSEE